MFSKFSEEAQKVLLGAKIEMVDLKHPYIGSEHLLLSMLKIDSDIKDKLNSYGIYYNDIRKEIIRVIGIGTVNVNWFLYTPLVKRIIENSIIISKEEKSNEIRPNHLLISLIEEGDGVANRILNHMDIEIDDLYDDLNSKIYDKKKSNKKLMIEEFGYDLNKKVLEGKVDPVVERSTEINKLIEILSRRIKNNPLLIGDAGVGKTAIVEELARRIINGDVPDNLKNKRIINVEISGLIAGTKYRGEFEERMSKIISELEGNPNIIIFIDEVHTLIGAGGAEGAIDASNILKPALSRGKINIIGATTTEEYKKTIEKDKAFDRRFQKINIEEPDFDRTYKILTTVKEMYESFHNVRVSDDIIKEIIKLSNKYIFDRRQPDKSIDILDEVCVKASLAFNKNYNKEKKYTTKYNDLKEMKSSAIKDRNYEDAIILKEKEEVLKRQINKFKNSKSNKYINEVTIKDVKKAISERSKVPIFEFEDKDKTLIKMEHNLKKTIIGQDDAINCLMNTAKKIKMGLKFNNKPISILFVGPTGVGKTLLVKEFAKNMFNNDKLIRLDMSEFKEDHSISKLIGSPSGYVGYEDNNNRFEEIRNNPYSVILLDEIEKASPAVLNLFLQILDEGKIIDSVGRVIHFENTIIIMTSNLGFSKKSIGFNKDTSSVISKLKECFSMEFINRIDNTIVFNELNVDDVRAIIKNKINLIRNNFKEKGINITIKNTIIDKIIEKSNYQDFGARQIDMVINKEINELIINTNLDNNEKILIQ